MKCDENRPVCKRCHSTGRVCDGYGVWGGGGNFYGSRQTQLITPTILPYTTLQSLSWDEKRTFEWYKCRVKSKVHGLFVLTFWETVLIQVALSEPAVLHAVLTISRVHENGVHLYAMPRSERRTHGSVDNRNFILKHYTKAIGYLQSHLCINDRTSARLALMTCVMFVCLELLRGHFRTAIFHLESGNEILRESYGQLPSVIDDWILDVFSRLYIQVALLNQHRRYPLVHTAYNLKPRCNNEIFLNFNQAWQQLEGILFSILGLSADVRKQQPLTSLSIDSYIPFSLRQGRIQFELDHWLYTYEQSRAHLQDMFRKDIESFAFQLLRNHHTIAQIMTATCLRDHDDETIFDLYEDQFLIAINHSIFLANGKESRLSTAVASMRCFDMSRSVIDIGWISPLYYVALKCRVHRLRLQAIRLLESSIHREGFWDANIAACVARKVMGIEEGDIYAHIDTSDDFNILQSPTIKDLLLPPLPEYCRVHDIDVTLPDGPTDNIILSCQQKGLHGKCREIVTEYNMQQQRWLDKSEDSLHYITFL